MWKIGGGGIHFGVELQSFKFGFIFTLFQHHHLAPLCWSTWSTSMLVVNMKVVHHHLVLDDMAIVYQVLFRNQKIKGCKVVKKIKMGHMTIIICVLVLRFPWIWFWFLWCILVCFSYIRFLDTIGQPMVAFDWDLQNCSYVYEMEFGIFSLFDFSPFDLTFLDSKVVLISLETFPNHWNHFKWSCSKICKNGHNT